jgi:hypothetical protein
MSQMQVAFNPHLDVGQCCNIIDESVQIIDQRTLDERRSLDNNRKDLLPLLLESYADGH